MDDEPFDSSIKIHWHLDKYALNLSTIPKT